MARLLPPISPYKLTPPCCQAPVKSGLPSGVRGICLGAGLAGTVCARHGAVKPSTPVPAASSPAGEQAANQMEPTAAADPTLAYDNSYWAQQPAAVQALRTMPESERSNYAQQLAGEGYKIDVPIMVWGWDPSMVTSMRQADGYTWVPSAMQNPVEVAPGLGALGSLAAYDPNNPPPGSIAVPPSSSASA